MKDALVEKLLAKLLEWSPADVARERPILQALAAYKYDEYQQFSAGSRFLENLARWLSEFDTVQHRRTAYNFVRTKLVFYSAAEIRHLVEIAYPDHVRPLLIRRVGGDTPDRYRPGATAGGTDFKVRRRQSLFLGLSDGARIDVFRRANPELDHEQIWQTHELSAERVTKLIKKLGDHLEVITGKAPSPTEIKFRTLVLLDDFSASGTSYYALPASAPLSGKITDFFKDICDQEKPASKLVDLNNLEVIIVLYLATDQARLHLEQASSATWGAKGVRCSLEVVQLLPSEIKLSRGSAGALGDLIENERYYDPAIHDEHFKKGGTTDARYGYASCGLPLVLHHNTPNNSIALLMSYEELLFRGLFPRIQRHKEMS